MSFDLPVLPPDWAYAPLDSCSQPNSVTYGVVQPGSALEAGKPLIRVNNFRDTRIDLSDVMYIAPEIEAKYSRTRLKGGEVLVTVVGTVGQVAVVPSRFAGFNVARAVAVIHPLPHIAPEWIALCIRSPLSQHLLGSRANTTVQTTINLKDLRALPIPMPPDGERRTIAEFVGAIDDRITLLRETNATLEGIAQALFKSWFVDFDPVRAKMQGRAPEGMDDATAALFPDSLEESELGLVPKGWRVGSVGDIASVKGGFAYKSSEFCDVGFPVVKIKNIVGDGTVDLMDAQFIGNAIANKTNRFALKDGDIVMAMTGATIGKSGVVVTTGNQIPYLNQRVAKFEPTKQGRDYSWLMFVAFQNNFMFDQVVNAASGSAQPNISTSGIESARLVIPTGVELLDVFNSYLTILFQSWMASQNQSQTLATLRDTLLPRLISGALRLARMD